jgi:hypothetical protein
MKKKSAKKQVANFEPTKVALLVATVAAISLVLFALLGLKP